MKLNEQTEIMKFDVRLIERNLKSQSIDEKEVKEHCAKLEDLATKCENLALREDGRP